MSAKNKIITDVLLKLSNIISKETLGVVENVLIIELGKYSVKEECTELICDTDSTTKLLQTFIANKRLIGLSENTLERYYQQNIQMLDFVGKSIDQVSTDDIRFYLAFRKDHNDLCNNTVDGMRRCITTMYNFLYAEGLIDHNPATALRSIKVEKKIKKAFSDTDMDLIRKNCKSIRDKALVEFLYSTGCRVSECKRVNIEDINFKEKELIVLGKGNKERTVYLNDKCIEILKRYLNNRNDHSAALFIGRNTNRLSKNGIEQVLKRIENNSGVVNIYPHRFRRTCATFLSKHMNILDISAILGHSSIETTTGYIEINQDRIKSKFMECMCEQRL